MARINTNVPSLIARSQLAKSTSELEVRLQRLSTGVRLNRGADDPAGLIISERLRSDIRGAEQGIKNAERAGSVIATTESALAEINELLNSIRSLVVEAANSGAFSSEEIRANQLQIDSAIDSITRISNTATFGGLKLLNGQLDYNLSGVTASDIAQAKVFGASFVGSTNLAVDVQVVASAQTGALYLRGDLPTPGSPLNGSVLSTTTLRIAGTRGVTEISVVSGRTLDDVITAVNRLTSLTGVRAERINAADLASGIVFRSADYGSDSFVSVERIDGPPNINDDWFRTYSLIDNAPLPGTVPFPWNLIGTTLTVDNHDNGRDVSAIINGNFTTGKGLQVSINGPTLSLQLLLTEQFATDPSGNTTTFHITGGGALFQLGPEVNAQQQSNVGIPSMAASTLGGVLIAGNLNFLSSLKSGQINGLNASNDRRDFSQASDILQAAIDEVSILRGRLGAFERNVLQTNVRSLQAAFENLTASSSRIRDADFAAETSELTRAQILSNAGTTVLALANAQSQTVLQLLG